MFLGDGRVEHKKERDQRRWGMKMRTIWRIRAAMRDQEYDLPDWDQKTPYQ